MEIKYLNIDCQKISQTCDLEFGKEEPSLAAANNLLEKNEALNKDGFGMFKLESHETINNLEKAIRKYIIGELSKYQDVPSDFELSNYHKYLKDDENHYKISTWALDYNVAGHAFYEIKSQIENMLEMDLKIKRIAHLGNEGDYIGFRILRPQRNDHNPFHRDTWIPYWRDTVNIWIPICGFEDGNSLQLIPQSHLWSDTQILKTKAGVEIDGKKYHVSAAIGTLYNFTIETPVLHKGEGLIFSPYLVHGNGVNQKPDTTRISLEFRFCRK